MTAAVSKQATDDPHTLVFYMTFCLSDEAGEAKKWQDEGGAGEIGRLFLDVPGVVGISVLPYAVLVKKANLFSWDSILPRVEAILKTYAEAMCQLEVACGQTLKPEVWKPCIQNFVPSSKKSATNSKPKE